MHLHSESAWDRIRTGGPLRDSALNAAPLAWLGYPRALCLSAFNCSRWVNKSAFV